VKAIVIGAGIGGLTCAIALRLIGWDVEVYERAPELREVGAGISIWANAMRSLDHLGAGDAVRAVGRRMQRAEMVRANGKVMIGYNPGDFERRLNLPATVTMTHRADLIAALASRLPPSVVRCGHTLAQASQTSDQAVARFANGHEARADLLVGADGIHSVVRDAIHPRRIPVRYSGYTAWRGICPDTQGLVTPGYVAEVWGCCARFGITSLPDGPDGPRVYWWATENTPAGGKASDERAHLLNLFPSSVWARPVPQLIEATPAAAIIRGDIIDREPHRPWSAGRIVMIGDAAHSTTPNLGQGGCMAIEDAPVLARCLREGINIPAALASFERERFDRTRAVTSESLRLGWLGQRSNPRMCAVRDFCLGLVPPNAAIKRGLKWANHDTGGVGLPAPGSAAG
jgi:2-polyprenyl-6-methoxyphenol hydroxylase-like FAD-dependent oxidoreductase